MFDSVLNTPPSKNIYSKVVFLSLYHVWRLNFVEEVHVLEKWALNSLIHFEPMLHFYTPWKH